MILLRRDIKRCIWLYHIAGLVCVTTEIRINMNLVFVIGPFDTEYLNTAVMKQRSLRRG